MTKRESIQLIELKSILKFPERILAFDRENSDCKSALDRNVSTVHDF